MNAQVERDWEARLAALEQEVVALGHRQAALAGRVAYLEAGGVAPGQWAALSSAPAHPEAVAVPAQELVAWPAPDAGLAAAQAAAVPPVEERAGGSGADHGAPALRDQATPARPPLDVLGTGEFWFRFVGIGLLLLGLAFFFKYSIDRGWLTEPVRIALALALGTLLLGLGLRLHVGRPALGQVLLGGSVATYYLTGYAAYQLFHLVPYGAAFGFMALVTALAYGLAVREDRPALGMVGVAGGLATPFVLTAPATGVVGLIAYACLVLAGATAIYAGRGWRGLLWVAYGGGWAVFALALFGTVVFGRATLDDRWALQAGALFGLLAFWAVPVLRETLGRTDPQRWPSPHLEGPGQVTPELARLVRGHAYALVVDAPLVTLAYSALVWGSLVTKTQWGWIALGGAAGYALVAWALRRPQPGLGYTHAIMAVGLLTLGLLQLLDGSALLAALAVEATALHLVARRFGGRGSAILGHLLAAGVALWLVTRLVTGVQYAVAMHAGTLPVGATTPVTAGAALTDLLVLALFALASFVVRPQANVGVYRNVVHFGAALWLAMELGGQPQGGGLVLLGWAAYAVALHLLQRRWPGVFAAGETTGPAHLLLAAAAGLLIPRVLGGAAGALAVFNLQTLIDATFVATLLIVGLVVHPPRLATVYRLAAHAGVLGLLARELSPLPAGQAATTLAWGLYAVTLTVASVWGARRLPLLYTGIATLFLVVAKLFLVDLVLVDPLLRVLLFSGCGGVFLALSYLFQSVIQGRARGPAGYRGGGEGR